MKSCVSGRGMQSKSPAFALIESRKINNIFAPTSTGESVTEYARPQETAESRESQNRTLSADVSPPYHTAADPNYQGLAVCPAMTRSRSLIQRT